MALWLYATCILLGIAGLVFQSMLHGGRRLSVYPLAFFMGLGGGMLLKTTSAGAAPYPVSFGVGMTGRAAMGGYWNCVLMEGACLVAGLIVGVYLI